MVTLYVQPARACLLFCRINSLKVDECVVDVTAGETRGKEFVKINPVSQILFLKDGNFVLGESATMMRYLAQVKHVSDHWYPSNPQGCARVDSALDWYHGNVRLPAIKLTWYVMAQKMQHIDKTKHVNQDTAHGQLAVLNNTLQMMEEFYLAENKFLAGNSISIADLLYSCELDEMQLLDSVEQCFPAKRNSMHITGHHVHCWQSDRFDVLQLPTYKKLLQPFPKVQGWMTRVAHTTSPHWAAVTAAFQKIADHGREKKQQAIAATV